MTRQKRHHSSDRHSDDARDRSSRYHKSHRHPSINNGTNKSRDRRRNSRSRSHSSSLSSSTPNSSSSRSSSSCRSNDSARRKSSRKNSHHRHARREYDNQRRQRRPAHSRRSRSRSKRRSVVFLVRVLLRKSVGSFFIESNCTRDHRVSSLWREECDVRSTERKSLDSVKCAQINRCTEQRPHVNFSVSIIIRSLRQSTSLSSQMSRPLNPSLANRSRMSAMSLGNRETHISIHRQRSHSTIELRNTDWISNMALRSRPLTD